MSSRSRTRRPGPLAGRAAGGGSRWSGVSQASRIGGWRSCVSRRSGAPRPRSAAAGRSRAARQRSFRRAPRPTCARTPSARRTTSASRPAPAWPGASSDRRRRCSSRVFGFEQQVTTHFLSPNPDEAGIARADLAGLLRQQPRLGPRHADRRRPRRSSAPATFPGCCCSASARSRGPTGGSLLSQATWIQRIHTVGGVAPATGCTQSTDVGALALVPYSTDYVFFR